jgi:hypothetical protein
MGATETGAQKKAGCQINDLIQSHGQTALQRLRRLGTVKILSVRDVRLYPSSVDSIGGSELGL